MYLRNFDTKNLIRPLHHTIDQPDTMHPPHRDGPSPAKSQFFEVSKRLYFDAGAALIGRKMRFEFLHRKSEYYFQEVDLPNLDHLFVACKGHRVYEIVAEEKTYAAFDEMIERRKQDRENTGFFRSLLNRLR